jgi:hypothetical protein
MTSSTNDPRQTSRPLPDGESVSIIAGQAVTDPDVANIEHLLRDAGNRKFDPDAPEGEGFTVELAAHGVSGIGPYRVTSPGERPVADELDPYVAVLQAAGYVVTVYFAERYVEVWPPRAVPVLREEIARTALECSTVPST